MLNRILVLLTLIICLSCNRTLNNSEDPPIARVYDNYLLKSQIENIVPAGLNEEDSLLIVRDHIEKWIRQQLLLYQADLYLTDDQKNVEKQINDYQTSLLIFKYEQNFIKQNLDTVISDNEIEDYYNNNSPNFLLNNNILKGRFIKVPRTAPEIWKVRSWYKSDDEEDIKELESYCFSNAESYNYFEEDWIYFNEVLNLMPDIYTRPDNFLKYRKNYETRDTTYYYFLKISDFRLTGTVTPIELVKDDIKSILINKRKIQLIQQLESNVYNDALNRDQFTIY